MSLTRQALVELIAALREELQGEIAARQALQQENEQLTHLLTQASTQYEKLSLFVKRLHDWASAQEILKG